MKKFLTCVLAFMLFPAIAFCSTTKVLDQDTDFHPQGWTSGTLRFKQGSQVELNDGGEIIAGVLKYNEVLHSLGRGTHLLVISNYFEYKAGTKITFDERGFVSSGTIGQDAYIYLIYISEPQVRFQGGTIISFDKDGNVINGTLNKDTSLRPVCWQTLQKDAGYITFKTNTEVTFGPNAKVIKGTIANDLTVNGITYPAGTTLLFSESANPQKI